MAFGEEATTLGQDQGWKAKRWILQYGKKKEPDFRRALLNCCANPRTVPALDFLWGEIIRALQPLLGLCSWEQGSSQGIHVCGWLQEHGGERWVLTMEITTEGMGGANSWGESWRVNRYVREGGGIGKKQFHSEERVWAGSWEPLSDRSEIQQNPSPGCTGDRLEPKNSGWGEAG